MQIAITKKLADALGLDLPEAKDTDPMCCWIANWTNVWANRKTNNMLILVHQKTKFPVAIFEVKKKDLKQVDQMMTTAIKNTLLELSFHPDMVDQYLEECGEVEFVRLRNRSHVSWVNRAGLECAIHAGNRFQGMQNVFNDHFASANAKFLTKLAGSEEYIYPYELMRQEFEERFDRPVYRYPAYELKITLEYDEYPIMRRIIVPADMRFSRFHDVLQALFHWKDSHLHDFQLMDESGKAVRLVPFPEDIEWDEEATLIEDQRLSDFFSSIKQMIYVYDFGEYWEHTIELVRVIEQHNEESPYVLEAMGSAPPEDLGKSFTYEDYLAIKKDRSHPDHDILQHWSFSWDPELPEYERRPRVLRFY